LAKTKYTPFLKLKVNEVGAIVELSSEVTQCITPFFDLPRKKGMTAASFCSMVTKAASKMERLLGDLGPFYLDNFDIPDDIAVDGGPNYQFVIQEFANTSFIPVVGLNRTPHHNEAIFEAKKAGLLGSDTVAIRLVAEDFEDFLLVDIEFAGLVERAKECFPEQALILDCRMCLNASAVALAAAIQAFINAAEAAFEFSEIIVAGSSIPAQIREVAKVEDAAEVARVELDIFSVLKNQAGMAHLGFGDYTVVSPMYSDLDMAPELLRNVTAPKILYGHDGIHYIARGGALKTHVRGNLQYNDMLADIVALPIYRGAEYSYGDAFIAEKAAQLGGKQVTPSSILKPTINAHITYMAIDHPLMA